jgi:hypothetical protein
MDPKSRMYFQENTLCRTSNDKLTFKSVNNHANIASYQGSLLGDLRIVDESGVTDPNSKSAQYNAGCGDYWSEFNALTAVGNNYAQAPIRVEGRIVKDDAFVESKTLQGTCNLGTGQCTIGEVSGDVEFLADTIIVYLADNPGEPPVEPPINPPIINLQNVFLVMSVVFLLFVVGLVIFIKKQ